MIAATASADDRLREARGAARRRLALQATLPAMPWIAFAALLAWRLRGPAWAWALALALAATVLLATGWRIARAWRRVDDAWMSRRLDAQRADMEDSAALLFATPAAGATLAVLQRARLRARIAEGPRLDLRPAIALRPAAASWLLALLAAAAVVLWPAPRIAAAGAQTTGAAAASTTAPPRIEGSTVAITPPAYTRLPSRQQASLDARVAAGSLLRWSLRASPAVRSVTLEFRGGASIPMQSDGERWSARGRIDVPSLYRVVTVPALPAGQSGLHRIAIIVDAPPRVRATLPAANLSVRSAGQSRWPLRFEADDDYGVAVDARLLVTQTVGSGEGITARRQTLRLRGSGAATRKTFQRTLDLASLGLSPGDDLIVQIEVFDNRAPHPQRTLGPSFILRSPPERTEDATGLDGLVQQALPAALRSQRQVIIDAEALQKTKPRVPAASFVQRSDAIGVDQRALRMRYGQFLGEESEGRPVMPTNDAGAEQATREAAADGHDEAGHDHGEAPQAPAGFGEEGDVLASFGHVHDQAGIATLLDPDTQATLRKALAEMWQSELQLRQGRPDLALPPANRALGFIKQVQQASRVYLQRTGIQPPPIDEGRRLGGDRSGIADRRDPLAAAAPDDDVPGAAWRALQGSASGQATATSTASLDALERWVVAHPARVKDPLGFAVAVDALRRSPDCAVCRTRLRARLWPLLAPPPGGIDPRARADGQGRAYLDALDGAQRP